MDSGSERFGWQAGPGPVAKGDHGGLGRACLGIVDKGDGLGAGPALHGIVGSKRTLAVT